MITPFRSILFLAALAPFLSCSSGPTESAALAQAIKELDSLKSVVATAEAEREGSASAATPEAPSPPPAPAPNTSGWTSIGDGFSYRGVRFSSEYGITTALGEVRNDSGQDYEFASFSLNVYDASGSLIAVDTVLLTNFGTGQVKSFDALFTESLDGKASISMSFNTGY